MERIRCLIECKFRPLRSRHRSRVLRPTHLNKGHSNTPNITTKRERLTATTAPIIPSCKDEDSPQESEELSLSVGSINIRYCAMKVSAVVTMEMASNQLSALEVKGCSHRWISSDTEKAVNTKIGRRMPSEGRTEMRVASNSRRTKINISNQKNFLL